MNMGKGSHELRADEDHIDLLFVIYKPYIHQFIFGPFTSSLRCRQDPYIMGQVIPLKRNKMSRGVE